MCGKTLEINSKSAINVKLTMGSFEKDVQTPKPLKCLHIRGSTTLGCPLRMPLNLFSFRLTNHKYSIASQTAQKKLISQNTE